MEMPGAWSSTAAEGLLESPSRREPSTPLNGQPSAMAGISSCLAQPESVEVDIAPLNFGDWDDIEM